MELFYCRDVRGCTEAGKGLEIVQKQETLLFLGEWWTTNTKHTDLDLSPFGKVIKKACCTFLLTDVTWPNRTLLLP